MCGSHSLLGFFYWYLVIPYYYWSIFLLSENHDSNMTKLSGWTVNVISRFLSSPRCIFLKTSKRREGSVNITISFFSNVHWLFQCSLDIRHQGRRIYSVFKKKLLYCLFLWCDCCSLFNWLICWTIIMFVFSTRFSVPSCTQFFLCFIWQASIS